MAMPDACPTCGVSSSLPRGTSYDLFYLEQEVRKLEAEVEHLREREASLLLEEPSKTIGLYAAIDELQRENERLRGREEDLLHSICDALKFLAYDAPASTGTILARGLLRGTHHEGHRDDDFAFWKSNG